MKNFTEFSHLYPNYKIPVEAHKEYYFSQLRKSAQFANLDEHIALFEDLESKVECPKKYFHDKTKEVIAFVQEKGLDKALNDLHIKGLPTSKGVKYEPGVKYLSVDLQRANWQCFKRVDATSGLKVLPETYDEFLGQFDVHPALIKSKKVRQHIFGKLNAGRQTSVQRQMMGEIEELLKADPECKYEICATLNDELVLKNVNERVLTVLESAPFQLHLKWKSVRVEGEVQVMQKEDAHSGKLQHELYKAPGNRFFMNFKRHILREALDTRDCLFYMEKRVAVWGDGLQELISQEKFNAEYVQGMTPARGLSLSTSLALLLLTRLAFQTAS